MMADVEATARFPPLLSASSWYRRAQLRGASEHAITVLKRVRHVTDLRGMSMDRRPLLGRDRCGGRPRAPGKVTGGSFN
eukprot:scaffold52581_cov93-Phaeocystis_antarctica.AAC.1